MATAFNASARASSEEHFFFIMACAMAATLVIGFSTQLALGRSSFAVPLVYHLHGTVFFGWVVLYLSQNFLVSRGNVALHRKLGWLAALWVPLMVVLGTLLTVTSLQRTGGPFFFDANEFLISNPIGLLTFAALVFAAVRMRKQTDWHRRLMLCGMALLTGPGLGRLLPVPLLIPYAWEVSNTVPLLFVVIAMLADKRRHGRVHMAYKVGLAAGLGWIALGQMIAYTPWGISLTEQVMAGHPGAARPMAAYLP